MSKKTKVQLVAIFFLLLAVFLLIPNTTWTEKTSVLGFISLLLGTLGSIVSIFIPTNYILEFTESDWKSGEDNDFCLFISIKKT